MTTGKTVLIIGASRGLGCALAAEYLPRGWQVPATVRGTRHTGLHALAAKSDGRLEIATVAITAALTLGIVGHDVGVVGQLTAAHHHVKRLGRGGVGD